MIYVYIVGVVIAVVVSCPDWPFYNQNPEKWQPSPPAPVEPKISKFGKNQ
jgi:hypothetical protein